MQSRAFPRSLRARFRWAIREGLLIAGVLAFWIGLGLFLMLVLGLVAYLIQAFRLEPLRFVYEFAGRSDLVWAAVTPLASATSGLYVLVRAGTILIDRYRAPVEE